MKKLFLLLSIFISSFFAISYAVPTLDSIAGAGKSEGYKLDQVDRNKSLINNIRELFFPSTNGGSNIIWVQLRFIAVGLLFVFLIWAGALFLLGANDESKLKNAKVNFIYILYGAFLIFGATWILGTTLNLGQDAGVTANSTVVAVQKNIIGTLLIFLKSLAYYIAIIMMVYFGFRVMKAQDKEDKVKAAKAGMLNIIIALIGFKVLDYLYFIAQKSNFKDQAGGFLTGIGKGLAWVLGIMVVLAIIYAAWLLFTSKGDEKSWKDAKTTIRNIFLVIFTVFLFVVIVYDIFKNLG